MQHAELVEQYLDKEKARILKERKAEFVLLVFRLNPDKINFLNSDGLTS